MSCRRRRQQGSFDVNSSTCDACIRRHTFANEIRQKGHGPVQLSVNNTFITQNIPSEPNQLDPMTYMHSITPNINQILSDALRMHGSIKFYITININMERFSGSDVTEDVGHFCSIHIVLLNDDDIIEQLEKAINLALERADAFLRYGSGWVFKGVKSVDVNSCAYKLLEAQATLKRLNGFKIGQS